MAVDLTNLVDRLSALTVIEAAELAKMLEEEWGVSAQPATTGALPPGMRVEPEPAPVEQTEFTVSLTGVGATKVQVVKELRGLTGLDLKSAMAMANPDELPKLIKDGVSKTEADQIKEKIEAAGGTVAIA
jgi:large subunit ribosomal protein L7/L12